MIQATKIQKKQNDTRHSQRKVQYSSLLHKKPMNILHDWTPREIDALNRALPSITEAKYIEPSVKLSIYEGVVWGYKQRAWVVYALIDGKRKRCGVTRDQHKAPDMQERAERAYLNTLGQ
mgnify:CR=1 FL=1